MAAVRTSLGSLDDLHVALPPSACTRLKPRSLALRAAGDGAGGEAGCAEQLAILKVTSAG